MTNVIPFTPKANADGGWTAAERARLAELAERLSAAEGVKVEAVYGVTDEGDPWCVVKDENEDILVHVARIDGQFVIHDAAADAIEEGDSLWTACDRLLGEAWRDPREEVVVPLSHRQAQSVIALALAVAFIHEVQEAEAAIEPQSDAPPAEAAAAVSIAALVAPPSASADELRHELLAPQPAATESGGSVRTVETPEAVGQAPSAPQEIAETFASQAAPKELVQLSPATSAVVSDETPFQIITGTDGHDTLQGTDGRDLILGQAGDDSLNGGDGADDLRGGAGADTLDGGGAGPSGFDVLDGGEGDDQIELAGDVVATGGEGADTFVINARPAGDGSGLLGVVLDFLASEGDRFVFPRGVEVTSLGETEVTNLTGVPGFGPSTTNQGFNGRQVWIDLDGDGVADGHVLIAYRPPGQPPLGGSVESQTHADELPPGSTLLG